MFIEIMNLNNCKPEFEYDVKVNGLSVLGSPFHNPFHMDNEKDRDKICDEYEEWFKEEGYGSEGTLELLKLQALCGYHGKLRLFCWCAPKRCHAQTIKNYLNRRNQKQIEMDEKFKGMEEDLYELRCAVRDIYLKEERTKNED